MRRVMFRAWGGPDVLHVEHGPVPTPAAHEVLVRVTAAGLNPVDYKLFSGKPMHDPYTRSIPSGNGYDFAGIIASVGSGATRFHPGDPVFGGRRFHAQADYLVITEQEIVAVPPGLGLLTAGALNVVGRTAVASVRSQQLGEGDTVLVSAAAGGVGVLAAQLALRAGARVIGTASTSNHDFLRQRGIVPANYTADLVAVVSALAPQGITAVLDNVGHGTVEAGLALGVPVHRINTIADYAARKTYGVAGVGGSTAGPAELAEIAQLLASGEVILPIDSVHPLEDVAEAYRELMTGHARGKIVLAL